MSAGKYDIKIDQGSDFARQLVVKEGGSAKDLTLYSARAAMRTSKTAAALSATFTCTIVDAAAGTLKFELSNAVTSTLDPGIYFYDLEIFTGGDAAVQRLLEGQVTVTPEITK